MVEVGEKHIQICDILMKPQYPPKTKEPIFIDSSLKQPPINQRVKSLITRSNKTATAGKVLPSTNSRKAPPPVEI